jgi:Fe2+ or Zn2+ uptake regulation protein
MPVDAVSVLRERGIQPSAQRVVVADYVMNTCDHPSADKVAAAVRKKFPIISRATVYNTLNVMSTEGCCGRSSAMTARQCSTLTSPATTILWTRTAGASTTSHGSR